MRSAEWCGDVDVEIINILKKNLGIIIKRLEDSGVVVSETASDHTFIPDISVDENGVEIDINGFLYSIKVNPNYSAVKFNIDRPITSTEYSTVLPGSYKIISRRAEKLYLKAPAGSTSLVTVEALSM